MRSGGEVAALAVEARSRLVHADGVVVELALEDVAHDDDGGIEVAGSAERFGQDQAEPHLARSGQGRLAQQLGGASRIAELLAAEAGRLGQDLGPCVRLLGLGRDLEQQPLQRGVVGSLAVDRAQGFRHLVQRVVVVLGVTLRQVLASLGVGEREELGLGQRAALLEDVGAVLVSIQEQTSHYRSTYRASA